MAKQSISISVIIPFYNAEKFIYDCAISLFSQSLKNIEFIFINDCSTDNSTEELNRAINNTQYPFAKTRIISHKQNLGIATSRNEGIAAANGDYIGFVDADDWIDERMFEKLYDTVIENNADIAWCDYYIEHHTTSEKAEMDFSEDNIIEFMRLYLTRPVTHLWNMLVNKKLYIQNNIRFLDGYDMCEDYNVATKLYYCSDKSCYLPEPLYHYRHNTTSICNTINKKNYISRLKNASELLEYFKDKSIYKDIKPYLYYRILLYKQFYLYEEKNVTAYMQTYPESNKYILSNTFYGKKAKMIEWLSTRLYAIIIKLTNINI